MRSAFLISAILFYLVINGRSNPDSVQWIKFEDSKNYERNILEIESELKSEHSDYSTLKLQTLLINNYLNTSQYNKAISFCQTNILDAKRRKLSYNEATLYRYLGNVYYHLNQQHKADYYWKQCLLLAEQNHYYDLLKRCNHNIGVIAFEVESDYKKAEYYIQRAIEYGSKTAQTKDENLSGQYRLLATIYDVKGDYKRSDSLFKLAAKVCKSFQDSLGLASVLTFQARLYFSTKNYNEALKLCEQAIEISNLLKSIENQQTALSIYVLIQTQLENYKEAFDAEKKIFELEVAKNSASQKKEIAEAEARFKVEEIRFSQELFELQSKKKQQSLIYIFSLFIIILLAFIIFFYQKKLAKREQALIIKSTQDIYEAKEKERLRIAQDLHDNMGAHTTSMLAQIDIIEQHSDENNKEKTKNLRHDAENIMATLRETIWILKTKTISVENFFDLIKVYANKHLVKNLNLKVKYVEKITVSKNLSPSASLNIYRILQEIIQNIVKHSKAKSVEITVYSGETIGFWVSDDGVGFDDMELLRRSGLENMEYRANEIGYTLTINSTPQKGTTIRLEQNVK